MQTARHVVYATRAHACARTNHKGSPRRALQTLLCLGSRMRPCMDGHDSLCPLCPSPASFVGHHQCIHHLYHRLSSFPPLPILIAILVRFPPNSYCSCFRFACSAWTAPLARFIVRAVLSGVGFARVACIPLCYYYFYCRIQRQRFSSHSFPLPISWHPSPSFIILGHTPLHAQPLLLLKQLAILLLEQFLFVLARL